MTTQVLDLDLDFFTHDVAHWQAQDDDRLDPEYFRAWSLDETAEFLEDRCGLKERLPGFVVTHHGEMFSRWRRAINDGLLATPLGLTHVDAHADLGLGDAGYRYLMSEVLFRDVEDRQFLDEGPHLLADGNWIAFAIACRWISSMTYVYNEGGGNDLLYHHMENFDHKATNIQLKAVTTGEMDRVLMSLDKPTPVRTEPLVPFEMVHHEDFRTAQKFDVICLAQSPPFTPPTADLVFEYIRSSYIDETVFQ